ncbi:hypothetical protein EDD86DRAFT_256301 [Gorgonomyces haynaldii]|nr:hypothetical protein EDD86DRAFT_256301 [Gorgonomyces haynaldii]
MGFIGSLLIAVVIVAILRNEKTPSMLLLLLLCSADWMLCFSVFVFGVIHLKSNGFSTGKIGCAIFATISLASCMWSMSALAMIAYERHLIFFEKKRLDTKTVIRAIAFLVVFGLVLILWPTLLGNFEIFALQPAKVICALPFFSHRILPLMDSILCVVNIILAASWIGYVYTRIIFEYLQVKNMQVSSLTADDELVQKKPVKETKVLKSCLAITLLFIIWELVQGFPVNPRIEIICNTFALLNSCLSPIFLYMFDQRIRSHIHGLFHS